MKPRAMALCFDTEAVIKMSVILLMSLLIILSAAGLVRAAEGRGILYYKCPMGAKDYSRAPGKAKCGMDYVPVYEGEADGLPRELLENGKEKGHEGHGKEQPAARTDKATSGKILYYKCPMDMPDFSNTPGKTKCGMDYVPVYAPISGGEKKAEKKGGSDRMMEGKNEQAAGEHFAVKLRIMTMDELMKLPPEELQGMGMDHSKSHHIGIEVYDNESGGKVSDGDVKLTVFDPARKKINICVSPMARHYCEDIDLKKEGLYQFEILVRRGDVQDTAWFEYVAE